MNKNIYYVYAYIREYDSDVAEKGTPYYIGKGKGKRAWSTNRRINLPINKDNIIILHENLSEEEAFKREIEYIAIYGRVDNGTGILRNLTNGGEGTSGKWNPSRYIKHANIRIECIETGQIFNNFHEVELWLIDQQVSNAKKITFSHIKKVCDGLLEISYGYHWRYVDRNIPPHKKQKTTKSVKCIDLELEFESLVEAAKYIIDNKLSNSSNVVIENSIGKCCRGAKESAFNMKWEFINDNHKNHIIKPRGSYSGRKFKQAIPVICTTNGMRFESGAAAKRWLAEVTGKDLSTVRTIMKNKSMYGYSFMKEGDVIPEPPMKKGEASMKKVICIETGDIFNSLKEAGTWILPSYKENSSRRLISKCCNGIISDVKGYTFKFIE